MCRAKIEFILEMIENVEKIVHRHGGVTQALEDFEGQMAILMAIAQIGETLRKIENNLIEKYDLTEEKEGAYFTRNYIVHNYEGVNLALIEKIVRDFLPVLRSKMESMLNECL